MKKRNWNGDAKLYCSSCKYFIKKKNECRPPDTVVIFTTDGTTQACDKFALKQSTLDFFTWSEK